MLHTNGGPDVVSTLCVASDDVVALSSTLHEALPLIACDRLFKLSLSLTGTLALLDIALWSEVLVVAWCSEVLLVAWCSEVLAVL